MSVCSHTLAKATAVLLIGAFLNLLAWTWGVAPAAWSAQNKYTFPWWYGVNGFLSNWTLFVTLVLFFALGLRNRKGVWSIPPPGTQPAVAVIQPVAPPAAVLQHSVPPEAVLHPMALPGTYYVPYYGAQPVLIVNAPPAPTAGIQQIHPQAQVVYANAPPAPTVEIQPKYPQSQVVHANAGS